MDRLNALARRVPTWVIYGLGLVPLGLLVWGAVFGGLGPDPVKAIERGLGERGLQFLLASLAITPLRRAGLNLVKFRRAWACWLSSMQPASGGLALAGHGPALGADLADLTKRPLSDAGHDRVPGDVAAGADLDQRRDSPDGRGRMAAAAPGWPMPWRFWPALHLADSGEGLDDRSAGSIPALAWVLLALRLAPPPGGAVEVSGPQCSLPQENCRSAASSQRFLAPTPRFCGDFRILQKNFALAFFALAGSGRSP
ncbi:MAG: hypothetical protein IPF65_13575 [Polaromonas sp.]|nr:hypothetical protein [Polaromonas sp.]